MQSYTVHLPDPGRRDAAILERAEFVPDGFAWSGLAFGGFWLAYRRLWVALAIYLVTFACVTGLGVALKLGPGTMLGLTFLMNLLVGLEGNQIHRAALEKSGRPAVEIVSARTLPEAESRFFAAAIRQPTAPAGGAALPQTLPSRAVLGVFPEPGGRA